VDSRPGGVRPRGKGTKRPSEDHGGVPRRALVGHVELQVGKVPALVDTGAQFSCVRSDVTEFCNSEVSRAPLHHVR
jgi:hypothetical protein